MEKPKPTTGIPAPRDVRVIAALWDAMLAFPEQRLCQIISNAAQVKDAFYVTDDRLVSDLRAYIKSFAQSAKAESGR